MQGKYLVPVHLVLVDLQMTQQLLQDFVTCALGHGLIQECTDDGAPPRRRHQADAGVQAQLASGVLLTVFIQTANDLVNSAFFTVLLSVF